MRFRVIGDGAFGSFLTDLFRFNLDNDSDNIFLAVPFDSYEEVAKVNQGKHLINVCSVQEETNKILQQYTEKVTGIHPLFGPNSFCHNNSTCIATLITGEHSNDVIRHFEYLPCDVREMNAKDHDILMSKVHSPMVKLYEWLEELHEDVKSLPSLWFPPSFKDAMELRKKLKFPIGTRDSIKKNTH